MTKPLVRTNSPSTPFGVVESIKCFLNCFIFLLLRFKKTGLLISWDCSSISVSWAFFSSYLGFSPEFGSWIISASGDGDFYLSFTLDLGTWPYIVSFRRSCLQLSRLLKVENAYDWLPCGWLVDIPGYGLRLKRWMHIMPDVLLYRILMHIPVKLLRDYIWDWNYVKYRCSFSTFWFVKYLKRRRLLRLSSPFLQPGISLRV